MLKFFAKSFEAVCSVIAVFNMVFGSVFGFFSGGIFCEYVLKDITDKTMFQVLFCVGGLAISFFFDVFVFGLIAQITEIRRLLENSKTA